jgi:hypothetical protein
MRRATLVAVALSCFVICSAEAGYKDGNSLLSDCEGRSRGDPGGRSQWGMCLGYILGVHDAHDRAICIPDGVKSGQVLDVVKRYLRNHPEERHHQASSLVLGALKETFPCN